MLCQHCRKCNVNRPRGLCWSCYYKPGIRDQYPSTSKYARRGVGNFCGSAPTPGLPTEAIPGSEEKIAILMDRALNRQSLWHPDDLTLEDAPTSGLALSLA